jgi:16S rRNA pseudouridine516 synthase
LRKYLANLGYGTRREVLYLFQHGRITHRNGAALLPDDRVPHHDICVDDAPLDPPPMSVIVLHKPVGYVCSTSDPVNPLIYDLLPPRFLQRSPIMSPVGRLDRETSGMLVITDDGQLNHRLTSPRSHVPKTYTVTVDQPLSGSEAGQFASGTLLLESDDQPLLPAELHQISPTQARVILHEGRYHQIRRMFAAVGRHVVALQRTAIGALPLGDLAEGTWRVLTTDDVTQLKTAP